MKIADFAGVADEVLEDAPAFAAWLNSVLALKVMDREDQYLIATLLALAGRTTGVRMKVTLLCDALWQIPYLDLDR